MHYYVICYDVSDDGARRRLAARLLRSGERVQESVFEIACRRQAEIDRLLSELSLLLPAEGNLRCYRMTVQTLQLSTAIGGPPPQPSPAAVVL